MQPDASSRVDRWTMANIGGLVLVVAVLWRYRVMRSSKAPPAGA